MAAFNYKQEYERYKKYYLSLEPVLNGKNNRAYTTVIFSFLVISLFGWYAIRPTMQTIFTLKREIVDRTDVDKKMEDKISALIEAQAAMENIQNALPALSQALPSNADPVRAIAQIRGLADEVGVSMTSFTVPQVSLQDEQIKSKLPTVGKVTSMPVTLSVIGAYPNVKQFLTQISDLRRITQISGMTFTPKQVSVTEATGSATPVATGTQVQVDLKLNVFYVTQ